MRPPELAGASETPVELAGKRTSVPLVVPSDARPRLQAEGDEERRVYVTVEDIEAERDPGLAYAVYLDLPGDEEERRHVGNISFFGIEEMNDPDRLHEGAQGFRYTFDATDVVNTLQGQNVWDPDAISVTFDPITVLPPPGVEGEEAAGEAERKAVAAMRPVKVGRVSLFVA